MIALWLAPKPARHGCSITRTSRKRSRTSCGKPSSEALSSTTTSTDARRPESPARDSRQAIVSSGPDAWTIETVTSTTRESCPDGSAHAEHELLRRRGAERVAHAHREPVGACACRLAGDRPGGGAELQTAGQLPGDGPAEAGDAAPGRDARLVGAAGARGGEGLRRDGEPLL